MDIGGPVSRPTAIRKVLGGLVGGAFVVLGILLVLLYLHIATSSSALILPSEILTAAFGVLAFASVIVSIAYAWTAYPQHHRVVLFVVGITLLTLLAHSYIIGSPPVTDNRAPVSGPVGTQLYSSDKGDNGNPLVTLTSSLIGQQLSVTVKASGSSALANLNLNANSGLTGSGFAPAPTFSSPLEPGNSVTGTWSVTSSMTNLSLSFQSLNCYKTTSPSEYGCIMDEIYYVPQAISILQGQVCTAGNGAPFYCHLEHPPLAPALIAAGMAVFGEYNVVGWRIMPVLLGTFSIPLLFGIAWKVSGNKKIAYVAALLLALDVMFFSQSSASLLDTPAIFFGLAAFFAYFAELRFWKINKYVIAGSLLGLAGLAKETAIFMALALLTYIIIFGEGSKWKRVRSVLLTSLVVGLVFVAGLEAYDAVLTTTPAPGGTATCGLNSANFIGQIEYIFCYGETLNAGCPWACGWKDNNLGAYITPFSWLTYYSPVAYYLTSVSVCPNSVDGVCKGGEYSYVSLAYYGVTNFLETWTVYVWVPLVAYAIYSQFRRKQPSLEQYGFETSSPLPSGVPGELKLAAFALVLFLWSYVPYILLFFAGRVTYPFYFLPAVPAVAIGCAYWLTRSWFPRWLMVVFLVMVFVFFFVYFPSKAFLPDWLRVLIGH